MSWKLVKFDLARFLNSTKLLLCKTVFKEKDKLKKISKFRIKMSVTGVWIRFAGVKNSQSILAHGKWINYFKKRNPF